MHIYIIHGWDGSSREPLLQWLKKELQEKGHQVDALDMPDPEVPRIETWLDAMKHTIDPDEETILVGHSIGCQAVLRFMDVIMSDTKIRGMVLLAPWMQLDENTINEEGEEVRAIAKPWMETPIHFKNVREKVEKTICIFSDNDPYVPLSQQDIFREELGAEIIVEHDKGHFSEGDDIHELPSALESVLKIADGR